MAEWWVRSLSFQARLEQMALPTVCDPSGRGNRRYYIAIVMTRKLEEKYTIFGSHLFLFGFALLLLLLLLLLCLFFFLSFSLSLSLSLSLSIFLSDVFIYRLYMSVLSSCTPEKGTKFHCRTLWATMWVLGIELRSSGRAVSALNPWAISPVPHFGFY